MGQKVATLGIELYAETLRLVRDVEKAERQMRLLQGAAEAAGVGMDKGFSTASAAASAFGNTAQSAANQAEQAFERSFREINQLASNAIKLPRMEDGGANLGAAQARAAAQAAQEQAQALVLVEAAARRAAAGEGEMTQQTRLYLAAAEAARVEAERNAQTMATEAVAIERLEQEFNQLGGAQARAGQNGRAVAVSAGQQRAAMQQLSFQIGDVTQSFALGFPMMTIFSQQGGQVFQALGMMQKEAKGFIGFMGGPWGAVLMGGTMILGMLASKLLDNKAATEAAEKAMKTFQDRQSDIANFIDSTTGALREQNKILVLNAILTRQANIAANEKEISDSRRAMLDMARRQAQFGKIGMSGTMQGTDPMIEAAGDADVARLLKQYAGNIAKVQEEVAKLATTRRPDLARFALDLTNVGGSAIVAARENEKLSRELQALNGNTHALAGSTTALVERQVAAAMAVTAVEKAQARLNDVRAHAAAIDAMPLGKAKDMALAGYARDLTAATQSLGAAQQAAQHHTNAHAVSLARQADAMEVNATAGLELANTYLDLAKSAIVAEARQKALTDATRKGIDGEAQTRRQLAIALADGAVQAGKSIAQLRSETAARAALNDLVDAGQLSVGEYNDRLKDELALLPLTKMQEAARAKGLKDFYDFFTRAIVDYRRALEEAHREEGRSAFNQARQAGQDEIDRLQMELKLIGATNEERAAELAMLQKRRELRNSGMSPDEQDVLIRQAAEIARTQERNNVAEEAHNRQLSEKLDLLDAIDQRAQILGNSLAGRFRPPWRGALPNYLPISRVTQRSASGFRMYSVRSMLKAAANEDARSDRREPSIIAISPPPRCSTMPMLSRLRNPSSKKGPPVIAS
jgi:hypothetical protein